ncbi:RNA polymerase sigma factor [Porticoccus sp. W117]|uniref:RNA polymerase sigma factor n=1 Tax=Porticoccus sp. W117 TaxID=3054777 RepID=UPI002593973B|nr:RNA polymerase sigma factor [Porticoccus sp. W117]MDM3870071.1 RNA polymerase sigma factor [Porticoccus sp. W117]
MAVDEKVSGHEPRGRLSVVSKNFLENSAFLRRFLARFLFDRQDIEDVAQEAYLRAFKAEKDKKIDQPKAFLFQIAKNLALTELTRKSRQITDYIEDIESSMDTQDRPSVEEEESARQHLALYCEALASLPERRRVACLLRKVHGFTHREIADRMGISISAVQKHLLKGMLACKAYIRERETFNPDSDSSLASGYMPMEKKD